MLPKIRTGPFGIFYNHERAHPALGYQTPAAICFGKAKLARGETKQDMLGVDRVGDHRSWAILARKFFVENTRFEQRKKKEQKERKEGLWKLTPLMEIRQERGFPQRLEKSLANNARLFHSSHKPDGGDRFTRQPRGSAHQHDENGENEMRVSTELTGEGDSIAVPFPGLHLLLGDTRKDE